MYLIVANKLYVTSAVRNYSQAVSMLGANAVQVDVTCFNDPPDGGVLTVYLEGSNDLENWSLISGFSSTTFDDIGWKTESEIAVAFAYVRLGFQTDSGTAVVAAGINKASL